MNTRHFLSLLDLSPAELQDVLRNAVELKKKQHNQEIYEPFRNKTLGMIFEKSSTRTRISFEAGMAQLGGHALFLAPDNTQLGRGEPIEDTARVLSRMVDIVMIRTDAHSKIESFAKYSKVPVINALTDDFHPCQLLADMQTYQEHRGSIQGKKVAWIGDGNNMCNSYINAAKQFDFELVVACPKGYEPDASLVSQNRDRVTVCDDITAAASGADLVTTDVWASMGQEQEQQKRAKDFANVQVNETLMAQANSQALFMHCLPAHRGEEISENMLDHAQSVVWDQAENRLHAQKALMEFLLQ